MPLAQPPNPLTPPTPPTASLAPLPIPADHLELQHQRLIITGGAGFLGRAIVNLLKHRGVPASNIRVIRSAEFDLTSSDAAAQMFASAFHNQPADVVIHAAGRVGGIGANLADPAGFLHDNLAMAMNVIEQARRCGLAERSGKVVFVGSACSYPGQASVPSRESDLWNGYPEPSNGPYGVAKRAAGELLRAYHRQHGLQSAWLIPTNIYGPGETDDPSRSHVIGALGRKFKEAVASNATTVTCWGTGKPTRDLLFVDDAAEGVVTAAERISDPEPINLGSGRETSILELAQTIAQLLGYTGRIEWDTTKPDGQMRRVLDPSRAEAVMGWKARVGLESGLRRALGV